MQLTIRLPDEYKARIDEVALKTGLKKSDIARLAIKNFLENFETMNQEEQPATRVRDLIGVVSSGISDLGTNHRHHLINLMREQKS